MTSTNLLRSDHIIATARRIKELRQKNINADAEIKSLKLQLAEEVAAGVLIVATHNAAVHKDIASLEDINTCLQEEITEHHEKEDKLNAEIKSLKLQLDEEKLAAEHRQAIFGRWGEELTQFRQKNINADAEIKSLKLSLADRDEEVKTLTDKVDKQTILANGLLTKWVSHGESLKDEIKTLKLSIADRDEEVKRLCSQAIERRQEKKELRDEIRSLKFQLADNNGETLSTHEHHRELRDKLHAEIKSLKLQLDARIEAFATRYVKE